ncbi:MAG: BLUF domain-containing protein [Roseobacter sp.]
MPELHFALYTSMSLHPPTPQFHNDILEVSQRNNAKDNLSGFLHREGDTFLQFLEGPKTALYARLAQIGRDTRHGRFKILQHGPATTRMLPDWQMGFLGSEQMTLSHLLDLPADDVDFSDVDPFDLVVFLASNAQLLSRSDGTTGP